MVMLQGLSAMNHRGLNPPAAVSRQHSNVAVEPSCMTTRIGPLHPMETNAHDRMLGGVDGAIPQHALLPDPPGARRHIKHVVCACG